MGERWCLKGEKSMSLGKLQSWYAEQCDGDWEHGAGIKLGTLDNPGWSLRVDLEGTRLESKECEEIRLNYDHDQDWIRCWVEDRVFCGVCGARQLERMISIFFDWIEG
jgi:hypothetical protein